jgi:hypothetical protein
MQNCILIRDPHENENITGVILTELSYDEIAKIADQCRSDEGDDYNDYDKFTDMLREKGCTLYIGFFDDIIF